MNLGYVVLQECKVGLVVLFYGHVNLAAETSRSDVGHV